jgi:hypothetical protein
MSLFVIKIARVRHVARYASDVFSNRFDRRRQLRLTAPRNEDVRAFLHKLPGRGQAIGLAELMKEAGLTVGGFYKHFDSREALVKETLEAALGYWQAELESEKGLTFLGLIDDYLSERHRDRPGTGCVLAALAGDIARASARPGRTKSARTTGRSPRYASRYGSSDNDCGRCGKTK